MNISFDQVQGAISVLHNQLWNPITLNPDECYEHASMLIYTGAEMQVASLILQAVRNFQQERSIIKYAYVADKLLKLPLFNEVLKSMIVDLYCMIFLSLWSQRAFSEIEELKKLRKYWLAILHPEFLNQMRTNIYHYIQIDIDVGFKPETIASIRSFYEKKLCMRPQDVALYLPQEEVIPPPRSYQLLYEKMPQNQIRNAEKKPAVNPRKRKIIEEDTIDNYELLGQPTKRVHIDPDFQHYAKCARILKSLKTNYSYSCRFCGRFFEYSEALNEHIKSHIQESIALTNKNAKKKQNQKKQENSLEQWSSVIEQTQKQKNQHFIEISQYKKYRCALCCSDFLKDFINDKWILKEAIKVHSLQTIQFMHKHCYQSLNADD